MANEKSNTKVNKSAEIRAFLAANPSVKPAEAAVALAKKGVHVSPAYISVVKSTSGNRTRKKSLPQGRRRQTKAKASDAQVSLDAMIRVKKLVEDVGSIAETQRALDVLDRLVN